MTFWQEYQGFVIVGAIIVLGIILVAARGWVRRTSASAADAARTGKTWQDSSGSGVDAKLASLATVVRFDVDLDTAAAALDGAKLPRFWEHPSRLEWHQKASKIEAVASTVARLESGPAGTRLVLVRGADMSGVPVSEPDWRKLRASALTAAQAADVPASEEVSGQLVRTPTTDVSGLEPGAASRSPHLWLRAAGS